MIEPVNMSPGVSIFRYPAVSVVYPECAVDILYGRTPVFISVHENVYFSISLFLHKTTDSALNVVFVERLES